MKSSVFRWNLVYQYGYTITNIINSLVLLPFYINYIGQDKLGLWLATGNILMWLTMVDPGIGDILQQKIASSKGENKQDEISKTIGSGLLSAILVLVFCLLGGFILGAFLPLILDKTQSELHSIMLAFEISIIATAFTLFSFSLVGINQGLQKSKVVAISYISGNIVFIITNIVLLLFQYKVESIAFANLARAFWVVCYNIIVIFKGYKNSKVDIKFEKPHFFSFIKIFLYTSSSKVVTSITNNIDLVLLGRFMQPTLVSMFEINRRPIKLAQGLITRYSVALMPTISLKSNTSSVEENEKLIRKNLRHYVFVTLAFSGLFLITYKDFINWWTQDELFIGYNLLILLVTSFLFTTIANFISNILFALGDIKANSKINFIKGIVSAVVYTFTIKYFGFVGFLISLSVVSFLFDFILFIWRGHTKKLLNWKKEKGTFTYLINSGAFILIITSVILFTNYYFEINPNFYSIVNTTLVYIVSVSTFWIFYNGYSNKVKIKLSIYLSKTAK